MEFDYRRNERIAPLAWSAEVVKDRCSVLCGRDVETGSTFFVEGAWNGSFKEGGFLKTDWFCGTGGYAEDGKVTFSSPSHVVGGLYYKKTSAGLRVSNSLYLLLAEEGDSLDPQYIGYEKDFNSILDGIYRYRDLVHTCNGDVHVLYYRELTIDSRGQMEIRVKGTGDPFKDYADYTGRLERAMCGLAYNAHDLSRRKQYSLVTTVSRGYDAPCCAVIAQRAGCRKAVTFKAEGKYAEDSGVEIARMLRYPDIAERDASEYLKRVDFVEAQYLCTGELGAQISFSAFDKDFSGHAVVTGERGDSVWGISSPVCNDEYHFLDFLNHLGSVERRLWLSYIAVPMPLYGAGMWTSIQRISQSEEMKPWSVGGKYDRPIPRRICEEAGIRRDMFGSIKRGAGFLYRYDSIKRIRSRMSPASGEAFSRYVKENSRYDPVGHIRFLWQIRRLILRKTGLKISKPSADELRKIVNPTAVRYLIPWAGTVVTEQYQRMLKG